MNVNLKWFLMKMAQPPLTFLEAFWKMQRKKWDTSCIGHFIGGSFPFKFVKDKVTKMWGNMGLQNVFFSSKGYFTFKFGSVEEMEKVLALNSVNIGGKRLYLGPWSDGSQFKRNAIKSISTWIRLIDVPHSYWSVEGLGNIAKVVGKPICLDNQTALLNPMKFAGVMVQLKYGTSYPKAVWVPVINEDDGSIVKVKVGIEYSAVPQSCKFCQAFGHPESKCESNPLYDAQRRNTGNEKKGATGVSSTGPDVVDNADVVNDEDVTEGAVNVEAGIEEVVAQVAVSADVTVSNVDAVNAEGTETANGVSSDGIPETWEDLIPSIDVTVNVNDIDSDMQADEIGNQDVNQNKVTSDQIDTGKENGENSVGIDNIPENQMVVFGLEAGLSARPVRTAVKVVSYNETSEGEEGEVTPNLTSNSKSRKRRKNLRIKALNGPFASTPALVSPVNCSPSKKGKLTDEEGFIKVISKRNLRSQGGVNSNPLF